MCNCFFNNRSECKVSIRMKSSVSVIIYYCKFNSRSADMISSASGQNFVRQFLERRLQNDHFAAIIT